MNNTYMHAEIINTEFTNDYLVKKLHEEIHHPVSLFQILQELFQH